MSITTGVESCRLKNDSLAFELSVHDETANMLPTDIRLLNLGAMQVKIHHSIFKRSAIQEFENTSAIPAMGAMRSRRPEDVSAMQTIASATQIARLSRPSRFHIQV